jgi:hypothetical protein
MNPWIPAAAWLALLLWLTLTPRPLPADLQPPGRLDLAGHLLMFAVLAFLVARAARSGRDGSAAPRPPSGKGRVGPSPAVGAALATLAAADELLQPPLAGRDASWSDFLANLAGIVLGLVLADRSAPARPRPGGSADPDARPTGPTPPAAPP